MADASWGTGWPNCQGHLISKYFVSQTVQGPVTYPSGIRMELSELIDRLTRETALQGYIFGVPGNPSYGCWGYNCRSIGGGNTPSNHSWGLAVDINAPRNPQKSPLTTDMPDWMINLWKSYGFRWGGEYSGTPDAMHYEFMGSVAECNRQTEIARQERLGDGAQPPQINYQKRRRNPVVVVSHPETGWLTALVIGEDNLVYMCGGNNYDELWQAPFTPIPGGKGVSVSACYDIQSNDLVVVMEGLPSGGHQHMWVNTLKESTQTWTGWLMNNTGWLLPVP